MRAVQSTGTPTVVVLSVGKPVTETWLSNGTDALLVQFYPSEEGGNALADVVFGDHNPSGRLPVSFPRFVGDLPIHYDYLTSGREITDSGKVLANGTLVFGHQYVLGSPEPWYPFGFGRSYSTLQHSNVRVDRTNVTAADTITVSVDVTNTDTARSAAEVVQVYVVDQISSVVVPNQQLKGFAKVQVPASSTVTVSVPVPVADLGLWNAAMRYVVEPGDFSVFVGGSSEDYWGNVTIHVEW